MKKCQVKRNIKREMGKQKDFGMTVRSEGRNEAECWNENARGHQKAASGVMEVQK